MRLWTAAAIGTAVLLAIAVPAGAHPAAPGVAGTGPAALVASAGRLSPALASTVSAFRPGVVLVGFRPGVGAVRQVALEQAVGGRPVRALDQLSGSGEAVRALRRRVGPSLILDVAPGRELWAAGVLRRQRRWVRYAELDYLLQASAAAPPSRVPNDPSFGFQWGDHNTGQTVNRVTGTPGADDRATQAWSVTTGSRSIVVGEPDTGVDYNHPDLAANIWSNPGGIGGCPAGSHGYDVISSTCDPMDTDTSYGGHGTHVAGIIGAAGDNGTGVAGMNWSTTILPVKWLGNDNTAGTTDQLITALNWLLQAKQAGVDIRVVNDSSVFDGTASSQALSDEIDELGANGILFVTAAGNGGEDMNASPAYVRYPCAYDRPTEICVTASDQNDALPSYADYSVNMVDLAAPGDNIYSTLSNGGAGGYGFVNGGSMAAAQVSGAAALILSVQDMSPTALKTDILDHVDPLPSLTGKVRTGGRLDVCAALPGCATPLPTQTAVACSPASVAVGAASTCTATVSDTTAGTSVVPSGSVSFANAGAPGGFSSGGACALTATAGTAGAASCSVTYTPSAPGSGSHQITASYGGDGSHAASSGTTTVTVPTSNGGGSGGGGSGSGGDITGSTTQTSTGTSTNPGSASTGPAGGIGLPPINVAPPTLRGTALPSRSLTCSQGKWANSPVRFDYGWSRNGASITGADRARYVVQIRDEATRLRCTVTAANTAGATTATAAGSGKLVALRHSLRCPRPRGRVTATTLGPLALGMSRAQARRKLPHARTAQALDTFCLYAGWGLQAIYTTSSRRAGADPPPRIDLVLTDNPYYSVRHVMPGMLLKTALRRLQQGRALRIGADLWYVKPGARAAVVLRARGGIVQAIGIATDALARTRGQQWRVLAGVAQMSARTGG